MKKWLCLFLAMAMLTGCGKPEAMTLDELMLEVNSEHQAVKAITADECSVENWREVEENEIQIYPIDKSKVYDPNIALTWEQVEEEIDYIFRIFKQFYVRYEYFGGAEAFDTAQNAVIEDCKNAEKLTASVLEESLLNHLSFVEDGHFWINMRSKHKRTYPFFCREIKFYKTEKGYQSEDGKVVTAVDGYENLDDLFRRSLTKEGEIVYYPIILKECVFEELFRAMKENITIPCDETLTVHFKGGKTVTLIPEPFTYHADEQEENISITEKDGITIFRMDNFRDTEIRAVKNQMKEMGTKPFSIIDLSHNPGGDGTVAKQMLRAYADEAVTNNHAVYYNNDRGGQLDYAEEDNFVNNEEILIVLQSKKSASSSESFVDGCYNLENTLVIGENSSGCLLTCNGAMQLQNSNMPISVAFAASHFLPDYFEENRGIFPDLWCPAGEAEEAALNLIKKNMQ